MRVTISTAMAVMILALCTSVAARGDGRRLAGQMSSLPDLAYAAHGKLWLRSLRNGAAWQVTTPWPVSGLSWSPDGGAIAFEGNHGVGVVALRGHAARTVFARRLHNCCGASPSWSPNGQYLKFSVGPRKDWLEDIWLWDRTTGRARLLVRGATGGAGEGTWAHDSVRLAVAVGTDALKAPRNPTAEIVSVSSGHVAVIGRGIPGPWSLDDRFLGFDHLWVCGVTGCFQQEGVMPSSGGPVTVLDRYIRGGWLTYEVWVPRRYGYAYDRWLLGPHGHVQRRIPGRFDRVEAWSPDGHWLTVRSLTKSLRLVLTLISADTGQARRLFVSAPTGGCDACINESYEVSWNHSSTVFAMLTPYVFGGVKDVNPSLYIYTLKRGHDWRRLSRGIRLSHPYPTVRGWVDHDREFIVYSGRTLFRYDPGHPWLVPIVRGLPYSENSFGIRAPAAVALRPGA